VRRVEPRFVSASHAVVRVRLGKRLRDATACKLHGRSEFAWNAARRKQPAFRWQKAQQENAQKEGAERAPDNLLAV